MEKKVMSFRPPINMLNKSYRLHKVVPFFSQVLRFLSLIIQTKDHFSVVCENFIYLFGEYNYYIKAQS